MYFISLPIGNCTETNKQQGELTLPEGQKNNRFDCEELQNGFVWTQQVACCEKEEEEGVERQADGDVVDDCDIQVPSIYAVEKQECDNIQ